jgi:heme-degrading monooxygenase HmoA
MFQIAGDDPGGPLIVMTTVGFKLGPELDIQRVVDFRRNVDRVRATLAGVQGNIANQVFTPHTHGDDGFTMTIWRDEAAMFNFAYRPGSHRTELGRYKSDATADRTSFTRFRAVRSSGCRDGRDPIDAAR